jgi:hypothetical protein
MIMDTNINGYNPNPNAYNHPQSIKAYNSHMPQSDAYSLSRNPGADMSAQGNGVDNSILHGVNCQVTNCRYNKTGGRCSASQVNVGPGFAHSSADTVCDTFSSQTDDTGGAVGMRPPLF